VPVCHCHCPGAAAPPRLLFFPLPVMSQVSALPSSSYIDNASGYSNTKSPDSEANPADVLRQAALSTRKLKRRKLDATPSAAPLPRPLSRSLASTPSISLDYGQEEPSPSPPSTAQQPVAPAPARAPTPTKTAIMPSSPSRAVQRDGSDGPATPTPLYDDASMREEGEISDNEDPPFRPPPKSTPAPITVTGMVYPDIKLEARGSVHSPFGVMSRSPSVVAEDAYQHATSRGPVATSVRRLSVDGQPAALQTHMSSEPSRLETPLYVLDPDHVRPGLSCSSISNLGVAFCLTESLQ
jgi:hypothetical protein